MLLGRGPCLGPGPQARVSGLRAYGSGFRVHPAHAACRTFQHRVVRQVLERGGGGQVPAPPPKVAQGGLEPRPVPARAHLRVVSGVCVRGPGGREGEHACVRVCVRALASVWSCARACVRATEWGGDHRHGHGRQGVHHHRSQHPLQRLGRCRCVQELDPPPRCSAPSTTRALWRESYVHNDAAMLPWPLGALASDHRAAGVAAGSLRSAAACKHTCTCMQRPAVLARRTDGATLPEPAICAMRFQHIMHATPYTSTWCSSMTSAAQALAHRSQ